MLQVGSAVRTIRSVRDDTRGPHSGPYIAPEYSSQTTQRRTW